MKEWNSGTRKTGNSKCRWDVLIVIVGGCRKKKGISEEINKRVKR